jgi:ATP-dependent DNA ligase
MAKYKNFKYIYPPRPKNAIPPEDLDFWDNGSLIAQPKLNGSNCVIFTDGDDFFVMNRHKQRLTNFKIDNSELSKIYRGNGEWMIINGEYMNKSKNDENDNVFNHKLVIFDILAYNGEYLVGSTFSERVNLLNDIYGETDSEKNYLYSISDNIYRVKSYSGGFNEIFNNFIEVDMLEGLVMKRANAKLEIGTSELNNVKSQLKCRKPTKNYKY